MKKILKLTFVLVLAACIALAGNAYAADLDCNLEIKTEKKEYKPGDEFTAQVYVSDIKSDEGVLALSATLEYDKDSLELKEMSGKNSWDTPAQGASYNEDNGSLAITRQSLGKKDEVVFEMNFKVKEGSDANASIELKDVTVANGMDSPKAIQLAARELQIKAASSGDDNNNNNNNNGGDNNNNNPSNPGDNSGSGNDNNGSDKGNTNTNKDKPSTNTNTNKADTSTNTNKASNNTNTNASRNIVGSSNTSNTTNSTNTSSDNTLKGGIIPKTGDGDSHLWAVIAGVLVVAGATYFYVKIKVFDTKNSGLRTK